MTATDMDTLYRHIALPVSFPQCFGRTEQHLISVRGFPLLIPQNLISLNTLKSQWSYNSRRRRKTPSKSSVALAWLQYTGECLEVSIRKLNIVVSRNFHPRTEGNLRFWDSKARFLPFFGLTSERKGLYSQSRVKI